MINNSSTLHTDYSSRQIRAKENLGESAVPGSGFNFGMTSERTCLRMLDRLREKGIRDEDVLAAMAAVPRHQFLDEALASRAYEDTALPIGLGQTISQPFIIAFMIAALRKGRAQLGKTLEVGAGCGYQAAILGRLSGEVHSVERISALHAKAQEQLQALAIPHVRIHLSDGEQGYPPAAPFDSIIVAAAAEYIPQALTRQLALGGRLIMPLSEGEHKQYLCVVDNAVHGLVINRSEAVRFVPLKSGVV